MALQDGVCAYCERSFLSVDDVRIEHVHPRSVGECAVLSSSNFHYEWSNLVGVCYGYGTCDEAKGATHICEDAYLPSSLPIGQDLFAFDSLTGAIRPKAGLSGSVAERVQRTIDFLGLDHAGPRESRKAVIAEVQRRMIDEGEDADLVRFDLLAMGFPTTVDSISAALS